MRFFLYSKCGEGCGFAKVLQDEGNDVKIFIKERDYRTVYKGILDQDKYIQLEEDTIIIFDSSGMGNIADDLRSQGYKVFGASKFHDKLENDREFGLNFMQDHGIMIPETQNFDNFKDGMDFVRENCKKRYVFKPSGDLPSKLTYSCSDSEDLIYYMQFVEKFYSSKIDDFVLQEFIEGKIISTEYYVGPHGFIEPVNHTVEVKKLMNGDLGPSTGCAGNLVWLGEEGSPISKLLRKVEEDLVKNCYIGPIDLNCIVNESGIYGLEWTPRFGLDAMPTWLQLLGQDLGQVISDIVNGQTSELELIKAFAGGIRISIPPYPIEPRTAKEVQKVSPNLGIPIRGLDDPEIEGMVYFYEVMKENDMLVHSEGTGVIAVVSDYHVKPGDCFSLPEQILEDCKVPDKMYRTDLREVLPEMYNEVTEMIEVLI